MTLSSLFAALRGAMTRPTATQLTAAMGVLAALALAGSLAVTGLAVRADQREKAALIALQDFAAMVAKLGADDSFSNQTLTDTDAAWLGGWLEAVQTRPGDAASLEVLCRTGRGGAGVRLIEAPGAAPAGLTALAYAGTEPVARLGDGVRILRLERGALCPNRAVEVAAVRQSYGALTLTVGRVVERTGAPWGRAALIILMTGLVILLFGLGAATLARRRLAGDIGALSQALDRAAVGDFAVRAPETAAAPELTRLTLRVNQTLDRLEELMGWLRDASDQLAHDFRTPLARASSRLDRLVETHDEAERARLAGQASADLTQLTRAMNEALALRDGASWVFETVRLDMLAAQVIELYEPVAAERDIRIETELSPVEVLGVRTLLQRAATNLVDNAVKYSPPGGVVRVTAAVSEDGAVFRIVDQGPGFAGAAAQSPGEGPESHGMGLPFVQAVARRHRGDLIIDDASPGAVVTMRFRV